MDILVANARSFLWIATITNCRILLGKKYYQLHGPRLLFLGHEFILSEANLPYEAKPSSINLPNLNINSYPRNMSPCNDFITYFCWQNENIYASIATHPIRLFTVRVINQSERGKSIKYVIRIITAWVINQSQRGKSIKYVIMVFISS